MVSICISPIKSTLVYNKHPIKMDDLEVPNNFRKHPDQHHVSPMFLFLSGGKLGEPRGASKARHPSKLLRSFHLAPGGVVHLRLGSSGEGIAGMFLETSRINWMNR